jgi:hypothetical protein
MKTRYSCLMVAFVALLAASPSADAGTQDCAVISLHAQYHTTKAATLCTTWKPTTSCDLFRITWPVGTNADVYMVIAQAYDVGAGVAGATCGIDYAAAEHVGVDEFGWTLCADQEFPSAGVNGDWPAAGSGNHIVWFADTNCQRTVITAPGPTGSSIHAIAGAFYLYAYSPDEFRVTPNPNLEPPELSVLDCNGSTSHLSMDGYGYAGGEILFGSEGYPYNPCDVVCHPCPVERSTWGAIKRTY